MSLSDKMKTVDLGVLDNPEGHYALLWLNGTSYFRNGEI